jgi:hypothetical protein
MGQSPPSPRDDQTLFDLPVVPPRRQPGAKTCEVMRAAETISLGSPAKPIVNLTLTQQKRLKSGRKSRFGMDAAKPLLHNTKGNVRARKRDRSVPRNHTRGEYQA